MEVGSAGRCCLWGSRIADDRAAEGQEVRLARHLKSAAMCRTLVLTTLLLICTAFAALGPVRAQADSYSAAVLTDNPVSYWRLGESSGTTAADESGANPGTYLNSPTLGAPSLLASDTADTAVSFDGVNDTVKVPSSPSLELGSTLSLEAWIKPKTALPSSGTFASVVTKASPTRCSSTVRTSSSRSCRTATAGACRRPA